MKKLFLYTFIILGLFSCTSFLGFKTKTAKPTSSIKTKTIRNNIKNKIHLSKFKVTVIDSTLNLFKNNALINIELEGYFEQEDSLKPRYFKKILFVENVIEQDFSGMRGFCFIDIDLTPEFGKLKRKKDNTSYTNSENKRYFKSNIEYRIYSCSFGMNKMNFRMNNLSDSIQLIQYK